MTLIQQRFWIKKLLVLLGLGFIFNCSIPNQIIKHKQPIEIIESFIQIEKYRIKDFSPENFVIELYFYEKGNSDIEIKPGKYYMGIIAIPKNYCDYDKKKIYKLQNYFIVEMTQNKTLQSDYLHSYLKSINEKIQCPDLPIMKNLTIDNYYWSIIFDSKGNILDAYDSENYGLMRILNNYPIK